MEKEILEQLQMIATGMVQMEERLTNKIAQSVAQSEERLEQKIKESEARTKVYIENTVTKKIEALFDGYKLVHEKQWEMERRMDALEQKLEELQNRIA